MRTFVSDFYIIGDSSVEINKANWQPKLAKKLGETDAQELIKCFDQRLKIVETADYADIRWMCHGHIGLHVIVSVYQGCVLNTESQFLGAGDRQRVLYNKLGACWGRKSRQNQCDFPRELLFLLGIEPTENKK